MPKSKPRKKPAKASDARKPGGHRFAEKTRFRKIAFGLAALLVVVAGGASWWKSGQVDQEFAALVAQGQINPLPVVFHPDRGGGHLAPGQPFDYHEPFPTSGIHDPVPANPGFYENPQQPTKLVHSLEHGHIVFYYDDPGEEALEYMKKWSSNFGGTWDGVLAVPGSGLGKAVLIAAWSKTMRLEEFNPPVAAAFVDRYRGRGPEHPVR